MTDFGTISPEGPVAAVRFERSYAVSAQELWLALTDPERMRRWLGAAVSIEGRRVGGVVRLRWDSGEEMDGVITVFEPERLLEYTWREAGLGIESLVRFELRPACSGTLLVLEHSRVPADQAPGFGAGWHGHLDALGAALAGQVVDPHQRYRELQPEYVSRFGNVGSGGRS